jgi:nickel-dependent lactate racemase
MEKEVKYGEGTIKIQIPDSVDVTVLESKKLNSISSIKPYLLKALSRAAECHPNILPGPKKNQTVAISIPDQTRPLPVAEILPHLLEWLFGKIPDLTPERVHIIIGCGLHANNKMETVAHLVPHHLPEGCHIIVHNAFNSPTVNFGVTSKGTPVLINDAFAKANYKIVVGQIDPHQIVGFTNSVSSLITGCSGEATLEHNHSLMFDEAARAGVLAGNPVREDMDEAAEMLGIDLAVDFVLSPDKEIIKVVAGHHVETLREGANIASDLYGVAIDKKFDIVIASCGGYPKDLCLYQIQKGLHLASQAVKSGGHILLLAALTQGVGDDIYFDYVSQFTTPEEVLSNFRKQEFKMGPHKAFLFGRTLSEFDVVVHSEMDKGILQKCHLRAADPTQVIAEWLEEAPESKSIGIITNANTTYFFNEKRMS